MNPFCDYYFNYNNTSSSSPSPLPEMGISWRCDIIAHHFRLKLLLNFCLYCTLGVYLKMASFLKSLYLFFSACGSLSAPANGTVNFSNGDLVGSIATFTCDEDLTMTGLSQIFCMSNGNWSGAAPTCTLVGKLYKEKKPCSCTDNMVIHAIKIAQQRGRPACAYEQSGQRFCHSLIGFSWLVYVSEETDFNHLSLETMKTGFVAKTLILSETLS